MFEIISFIFGGLFRIAPKLMEMREKKLDREHERLMFGLQMEADTKRAQLQMQSMEKQAEIHLQNAELTALVEANKAQMQERKKTGNKWLDWLIVMGDLASSLVRPILTYWYCVVGYGAYKGATLYLVLAQGVPLANAITAIWTSNDHAVMFSIIGFWFVDRAIRKREGS